MSVAKNLSAQIHKTRRLLATLSEELQRRRNQVKTLEERIATAEAQLQLARRDLLAYQSEYGEA